MIIQFNVVLWWNNEYGFVSLLKCFLICECGWCRVNVVDVTPDLSYLLCFCQTT
jgi:hypothetical protein